MLHAEQNKTTSYRNCIRQLSTANGMKAETNCSNLAILKQTNVQIKTMDNNQYERSLKNGKQD